VYEDRAFIDEYAERVRREDQGERAPEDGPDAPA